MNDGIKARFDAVAMPALNRASWAWFAGFAGSSALAKCDISKAVRAVFHVSEDAASASS